MRHFFRCFCLPTEDCRMQHDGRTMATRKSTESDGIEGLINKNIPGQVPEAVEGNALLKDLIKTIKNYVVVSDQGAIATALWIINSWAYESFSRCPLLLINAPERECGKTQLLKVVDMLASRPMETANISTAALFRMVETHRPTLLIDEADMFMNENQELAGIINKGYEKGGVVVRVESDGDEYKLRPYRVYGPKALAGIMLERHLPDATLSRGIQIPMQRKTRDDKVARLRTANPLEFKNLFSRIHRFIEDHRNVLVKGWDALPEDLGDRQQDNWEPLLAIAACLGEESYELAVEAALDICKETAPAKSTGNRLLEDIREVLADYRQPRIPSSELVLMLTEHEEMDWNKYFRGEALTQRQLAKLLAHYKIQSKTVRMGNKTPKGYEIRDFDDAFTRYLMPKLESAELSTIEVPPILSRPSSAYE
ncbi:MAG: DUF3631 domain-containing protein [Cytophagaceae bacterium]|nr:MAG: DUF3631 domain-containing protein [Cytophagaceae bacterium]